MKAPKFNQSAFDSMKKSRGLDFLELNMKVTVYGCSGKVIGNRGQDLMVEFENGRIEECNPFWRTEYYGNSGNLIKKY